MNKFEEFKIREELARAISEMGFENLTPIQEQAIPLLREGNRDFIGLAQTGTGKTAAFGIPLIQRLDMQIASIQALILAPTRELCVQIAKDLKNYCKYLPEVKIAPIYGGASIEKQISQLKKGVHITVATPGRLNDLIRRKKIDISAIRYVVLDEADEMLNMGFQEDIDGILECTPDDKNTWLFAATMPQEIYNISRKYMNDPAELTIGKKNVGAENIEHFYYVVHEKDRYAALKRLVDFNPDIFAIIFCRTKIETQEIAERLVKDGYNADALHGDLNQNQRDKVMKHYRERSLQLLVATDVAARGIDVSDVTHVVNYQLPNEIEIYTHRSGRTARAGKSGITVSITNTREMGKIRQIERQVGKKFVYLKVPDGIEICEKQLLGFMKKIKDVEVNQEYAEKYLPLIIKEFEDIDKDELIKRVLSLEFNRFLEYYRNAQDLNIDFSKKDHTRVKSAKGNAGTIFINLGIMDGFNTGKMLKYFIETTGLSSDVFGRINIKSLYSFVDVKEPYVEDVLDFFDKEVYKGRKVKVDLSSGPKKSRSGKGGRNFSQGWKKKKTFK